MSDKQTINGVPRELLRQALLDAQRVRFATDKHVIELQALLDAPASIESLVGRASGSMVWRECAGMVLRECAVCQVKGSYHPDVRWCICGRAFEV